MGENQELEVYVSVINKHNILEKASSAKSNDWLTLWQQFSDEFEHGEFENDTEKNMYTDLFFYQCLNYITPAKQGAELMDIVIKWLEFRKAQNRCGHLPQAEKITLIHFLVKLRGCLLEFLTAYQFEQDFFTEQRSRSLIGLWRQAFFEPFSALCLYWNPAKHEQEGLVSKFQGNGYYGLAAASMYQPFAADEYRVDAEDLMASNIPMCLKTIIIIWMLNTPYFHSTEQHRQKILHYLPMICKALLQKPEVINTYFFFLFVQEVMTALWRVSYIGGNNLPGLTAFGDFITTVMQRSFVFPEPVAVPGKLAAKEKIRIGYISRNFFKQAVSCYMVNRVIHYDRDKFEVYIFALGDYHDAISDLFQQNAAHFERFTNLSDLRGMAERIREHKLDILIFTDIGMDPVTYMLSGLKLAPAQCALVGHGTSTGMPNIQYYLSGDFEAPEADAHYSEKLIRLPNLGAAQYLPLEPQKFWTRKKLGIPKDAVVFVSCANGLKHGKARYQVFVDILAKASNAWIVLKPYTHPNSIDYNFAGEVFALAAKAGVLDRLKIIPPLGDAAQVLGLLSISDVQLDSYPYGGWTTNMEALYMGLPIVTQEGELARSRWGAGMLRALGVTEGIAANEEEYVEWAVRFAEDTELRKTLRSKIKRAVKRKLFNGPAAQKAYDEVLLEIYQESTIPKKVVVNKVKTELPAPVIATSFTPENVEKQKLAMSTWQAAGFHIVSINAVDEIAKLMPYFPDTDFVAAQRDARDKHGRPYIYFDDFLTYFQCRDMRVCGIVKSDIFLVNPNFKNLLSKEIDKSIIFGSGLDLEENISPEALEQAKDFDFFFFDRQVIEAYPRQFEFCLGLPWCGYWAALVPLMRRFTAKRVCNPIALHIKHKAKWSEDIWHDMGRHLGTTFKPPFELTTETMSKYADETLTIIKTLAQNIEV